MYSRSLIWMEIMNKLASNISKSVVATLKACVRVEWCVVTFTVTTISNFAGLGTSYNNPIWSVEYGCFSFNTSSLAGSLNINILSPSPFFLFHSSFLHILLSIMSTSLHPTFIAPLSCILFAHLSYSSYIGLQLDALGAQRSHHR